MKKIVSLALVLVMILTCTVAFASCKDNAEAVGVYEMVSISGTITKDGQVQQQLSTDLYKYYRITLNEDGTAKIESQGQSSPAYAEDATWELDGEELLLTSAPQGVDVVEKMTLKDGKITYVVENQMVAAGTYMSMTLILEKQ